MALRQLLDNAEEKTRLLQRVSSRRGAPVRPPVETVWAIVFILACTARCEPEFPSPRSTAHRAYDVLVTRYSSTYHPRTYRGLLATDGKRHRVAFYWFDPVAECEQTDSLAFSDLLFYPDKVSYWHQKDANRRHTLPLVPSRAGQLPTENTLESILQSIVSLVVHNRTAATADATAMETARFFQRARQHARFDHTIEPSAPEHAAVASLSELATDDFRILNELPFGRKYSKQIDQEGNVVWHVSKTTISRDVVRVTVRPRPLRDMPGRRDMFDPNTLGRWSAVPEPYRQFWSFKRQNAKLRRTPSVPEAERLYADIDFCLGGSLPDDVNLALHKLRFTVSLETGRSEAMSSAAREYFHAYGRLAQQPVNRIIVELGRITKGLRKKWSDEQTRDFILPLLKPLVDPKVFSDRGFVKDAIFGEIQLRGQTWSWYGQLVLESIQDKASLDPRLLARLAEIVEDPNHMANVANSEPNEPTSSTARREAENDLGED